MNRHTLPPGNYYIGDPGNVIDGNWDAILSAANFFEDSKPLQIHNCMVWGHRTLNGNGSFTDQNGIEYVVADGIIGAVDMLLIDSPEGIGLGTTLVARDGLDVNFVDGVFYFNDIVIDSNDPADTEYGDLDGGYGLDPADDKFI